MFGSFYGFVRGGIWQIPISSTASIGSWAWMSTSIAQ